MRLPLLERKARLEPLLSGALALIHFSSHVVGNGAQVSKSGSKLGVEGMVSKQIGKPYFPGNRGRFQRELHQTRWRRCAAKRSGRRSG